MSLLGDLRSVVVAAAEGAVPELAVVETEQQSFDWQMGYEPPAWQRTTCQGARISFGAASDAAPGASDL